MEHVIAVRLISLYQRAQIQSLRAAVKQGCLSYQEENTSKEHGISGESDIYLVGYKTWLDYGPKGLECKMDWTVHFKIDGVFILNDG